jgi:hypothetical protein
MRTIKHLFWAPAILWAATTARMSQDNPATPDRIAEKLRISLQAWRDGKCDGVVTYCLDKGSESPTFSSVQKLFRDFGAYSPSPTVKSLTIDFAGGDQAAKRLELARMLVAQMAAGQFGKATAPFDATMRRVLPATKLKEVWDGLTKQYGPLQRAVDTKTEKVQQYKVVYVTCEFPKGKLDAKIVFTQKNEVPTKAITGCSALKMIGSWRLPAILASTDRPSCFAIGTKRILGGQARAYTGSGRTLHEG